MGHGGLKAGHILDVFKEGHSKGFGEPNGVQILDPVHNLSSNFRYLMENGTHNMQNSGEGRLESGAIGRRSANGARWAEGWAYSGRLQGGAFQGFRGTEWGPDFGPCA